MKNHQPCDNYTFTQEQADDLKKWVDDQVGKRIEKMSMHKGSRRISDDGKGFSRFEPSGEEILELHFKPKRIDI